MVAAGRMGRRQRIGRGEYGQGSQRGSGPGCIGGSGDSGAGQREA